MSSTITLNLITLPYKKMREPGLFKKIPNLAMGYLSAYLKLNNLRCNIIDAMFENISLKQLLNFIKNDNSIILGISATTPGIMIADQIAKEIKRADKNKIIVLGGPHTTVMPVETLQDFDYFDIAVVGEGEETLVNIVKCYNENNIQNLRNIKGVAYRKNNEIIFQKSDSLLNLDALPYPDWRKYKGRATTFPVLLAKGCPYKCIFCVLGETKIRARKVESIIDETTLLINNFQVQEINFCEENFGIDTKRTTSLLNSLIKDGLNKKIKWNVISRIELLSDDLIKLMKEANCSSVAFGVESASEELLKASKKGIELTKVKEKVELLKKHNIKTYPQYLIGLPNETVLDVLKTINFATSLQTTTTDFNIMVPFPGTKVHEMAQSEEGGYKLLYKDRKKLIENIEIALELKSIKRTKLEFLQIYAKIIFLTKNKRYYEMLKFLFKIIKGILPYLFRKFKNV